MLTVVKLALPAILISTIIGACVRSEVTPLGEPQAALPEGCPVTVFPSTTPNYEWKDIASAEAECHFTLGRTACIERLKKDACEAGGDTVYAFSEGRKKESIIITATIARRTGGTTAVSGPTPPASSAKPPAEKPQLAAETCNPPCSPGYQCQGTTCVALCNPACSAGMHCANDRTCQPDKPAAAAK
jgi:hypothetical protein